MAHALFTKKFLAKINTIIRNFWWAGHQEEGSSTPFHFRAWDDICQPKSMGGLGIKDLYNVNKSLLLKTAWNIVTEKDPNLTAILKGKYFHKSSFWTAPSSTPKSLFWASILKIRETLTNNCSYQILRGNTTIWNQPWVQCWTNMHNLLSTEQPATALPNSISDLWLPNTKTWDYDKIKNLFGDQAATSIANLTILNQDGPDILCWKPSTSGKCTARDAYNYLTATTHNQLPQTGSRSRS
ncbi:hypothetical protein PVAP13_7KG344340, partial [Panicum virgatum]